MLATTPTPQTLERYVFDVEALPSTQHIRQHQKPQLFAQWVVEGGQLVCKWFTH